MVLYMEVASLPLLPNEGMFLFNYPSHSEAYFWDSFSHFWVSQKTSDPGEFISQCSSFCTYFHWNVFSLFISCSLSLEKSSGCPSQPTWSCKLNYLISSLNLKPSPEENKTWLNWNALIPFNTHSSETYLITLLKLFTLLSCVSD